MTTAALELHGISKHFGGTRALADVDLVVGHREVHALLGENGSGKSTLVKVLAGVHVPEPGGRLVVDGVDVPLPMPAGAFRDAGLSFVHQDLGLARPLTVLENLVGGADGGVDASRWRVHWRRQARRAAAMLRSYGVDVDPHAVVNSLRPVDQALVAIARAAEELKQHRERTGSVASVLVLDEPTVFLPEEEMNFLFDLVRTVVAAGASVIFISHDLGAVRAIADRVTVLRDGVLAATADMGDVSDDEIVELIAGPEASAQVRNRDRRAPAVVAGEGLTVRGLVGQRVRHLDFDVARGEIVGIAGLLGSGAEEVPYLLFGAQRATAGEATVHGRNIGLTRQQPAAAVMLGMALIPADRQRDAIAATVSVAENMMLLAVRRFTRHGRLRTRRLRAAAAERAEQFDVRPRQTAVPVGTLSGGNAQKVVLAKWLEIAPKVLLLHEPTQGVDVAARAQIWRNIAAATESGMSVVWVSSDFEELATVCDRVLIVSGGVNAGEIPATELSPETITTGVFAGVRHEEPMPA